MDPAYTLLLLAAVTCPVSYGHIPPPENIQMDSRHFVHLLTWEAGPGSPAGLCYRVTFRSYKDGWRTVDSCAQVRYPLLCNLTDFFSDLNMMYYINVTAVLGKETSTPRSHYPPFRPVSDTEPEPPSLRLSPCNDSLCVHLRSPSQRLQEVYETYSYTLNVTNDKGAQVFLRDTMGLETVELKVVPGLQYCVSVNIAKRRPANKTAVCSSKPAADNNMDAVIPGVMCLMMLAIAAVVCLFILQRPLNTGQPLVLRTFNAPYKVQLLWPSAESLKRVTLEPVTYKHVNEEADHEKEEDEEVAYEKLRGCQDASCEKVLDETSSSLPGSPENQFERNRTPGTETYTHTDVITPHWDATSPQFTSPIHTTRSSTLKIPILQLKKDDSALLMAKRGDRHGQEEEEEEEDSDDVNFFSVTLGGQNLQCREEAEKEDQMENVFEVKPEGNLCAFETLKPSPDAQPTSESTSRHISYSEDDEEEEDTEEEDAFSGYMMRS